MHLFDDPVNEPDEESARAARVARILDARVVQWAKDERKLIADAAEAQLVHTPDELEEHARKLKEDSR